MIDTHLHFWNQEIYQHKEWLANYPMLQREFFPEDVRPAFQSHGVARGVLIEAARDSHAANLWWLALAEQYEEIGAVVAGCALEQEDLAAWFDAYQESPYFVGVRTKPAGPPDEWRTNPGTLRGLQLLQQRGLSLDLLVGYEAFAAVADLAAAFPDLPIILDHCAHPPIRERELGTWAASLKPLAAYPNLYIKYSSLLLYSYPDSEEERLRPVTDFLFTEFGVARMMWGSNWPVELLGGSYDQALETMARCAPTLTDAERQALYHDNAAAFYRVQ